MADGTTDAPANPFREKWEMVSVKLTDKYDGYTSQAGARYFRGELASFPKAEAEKLIQTGAAVRHDVNADPTAEEKKSAHPHNKMQDAVVTK